jgi:methionyl-tRNA formyltransferase
VEVFRKLTVAAETVLKRALPGILSGKPSLKPQNLSAGSYYGRRRPEDGRIDWTKSAKEIHDLVRAVAPPFPGAFSGSLRINRTRMEENRKPGAPGPYREGGEWFAGCGDGKVLRLLEVQESQ